MMYMMIGSLDEREKQKMDQEMDPTLILPRKGGYMI